MAEATKIIVIGAGWSGLAAAKTYLEISKLLDRPIEITILDDALTPGGVWSTARLYPGLVANSPSGLYEFSDLTMVDAEHPSYQLIPGDRVQSYLEAYARKFDVYNKIRFGIKVVRAKRNSSATKPGWTIETSTGEALECDKLIVASGLYSNPSAPSIPMSTFKGKEIHSRSLGTDFQSLVSDPEIRNIVVVGGCKSSVETCSAFLSANGNDNGSTGKHRVSWIVRPSEEGVPILIQNPDAVPNLFAANQTRVFSVFSPSVFATTGFWYRFLHSGKSTIGSLLQKAFFSGLSWAIASKTKYDKSENGRTIKPKGNLFFKIGYISALTSDHPFLKWLHADNPDLLKVYRGVPVRLEDREMVISETLVLQNGVQKETRIKADAVIWCTGWQPSVDFFDDEESKRLGIPVSTDPNPTPTTSQQKTKAEAEAEAEAKADSKTSILFPSLLSNPFLYTSPPRIPKHTQFRLHRQILPLSSLRADEHSIVFAGFVSNSQTAICSELTALWGVAWLENLLPFATVPPSDSLKPLSTNDKDKFFKEEEECIDQVNSWMKYRYGYKGLLNPEIILEVQSFLDLLCADLGVSVYRKQKQGWTDGLREWVTPYLPRDYEGIVAEFVDGYIERQSRR